MPIEIRELIIKATVLQENDAGGSSMTNTFSTNNAVSPKEELISLCVEKILETIKEKNER